MSILSRLKQLFSPRVAKRIASKAIEDFRKLSPAELLKIGQPPKSERYIERGARLTKKTPTISKRQFTPERLAKAHAAGERPYAGETLAAKERIEAQARAQSATLRKRREQVSEPQYRQVPTNPIVYLNTAGIIASDYFSGRNLVMMHLYRDAYDHAVYTGDGTGLRRFKHITIITYDGPGLPNYRNKGVQIYPETNLKKLLAHRNRMTARDRIKFDNDRNYRHVGSLAA
jgi:hypothetical protein